MGIVGYHPEGELTALCPEQPRGEVLVHEALSMLRIKEASALTASEAKPLRTLSKSSGGTSPHSWRVV